MVDLKGRQLQGCATRLPIIFSLLAALLSNQAKAALIPASALPFYPTYCNDNTGQTSCSGGFAQWIQDGITQKRALYAQAGRYRLDSQQTITLTSQGPGGTAPPANTLMSGVLGISIYCDGPQLTQFVFDAGVASPNLQLVGQDLAHAATPTQDSVTYPVIRGCGFSGSVNGTLMQIGTYDYGDAINEPQLINDEFHNNSSGGSAVALQLNFVLNGYVDVVATAGIVPPGQSGPPWTSLGFAALDCRACAFNNFYGSYGYSNNAIVLRDGWTFGNTFHSVDVAVFTSAVYIPNETVPGSIMGPPLLNHNVFLGGTFSSGVYGINAAFGASSGNIMINPTFASVQNVPANCTAMSVVMTTLTGTCN